MNNYTEEYFFLMRDGNSKYPILRYDKSESTIKFYSDKYIPIENPVELYFKDPIPEKPILSDYHSLPAHVISKRIKEAIEVFPLKGVQFIPAVIYDDNDKPHSDYFIIHVYNFIRCINLEKSIWKPALTQGNILTYKKLVFKDEVLEKIPLNNRLVFALAEESTTIVFHKSVAYKMLDNEPFPESFLFCSVAEWEPSVPLKNEYYANEWGL